MRAGLLWTWSLWASAVVFSGCDSASTPPPRAERKVFCLTTEFLPEPPATERNLMRYPLIRELGRQAVLIAARDGLGLPTRDESLGETFSVREGAQAESFGLAVRAYHDRVCRLRLSPEWGTSGMSAESAAKLKREYHFRPDTYNVYSSLAQALATASRADLVESLSVAGLQGEPVVVKLDAPLPEGAAALLDQMNFVSQYAAVRAIHEAILDDGESPARLAGLARGYASLALLARHHWSSADSAFSARALLYAERAIALDQSDPAVYWHRAYACALIGMHRKALKDLDLAARNSGPATKKAPSWVALIEPFCKFEHDELTALAKEPGLTELAPLLAFELKSYYVLPRWTGEAGLKAMTRCPEAYCVHSEVADHSVMAFQRLAERSAATNFGGRLPRRVAALNGLPQPVQEMLGEFRKPANSVLAHLANGREVGAPYSDVPSRISESLREEIVKHGDLGEPSWDVLAQLIRDEQFIQLANTLEVAQNAVEYSKKDMVDAFMPLVKGHPYAPYIESFAFNKYQQPEERRRKFLQLALRDPRVRMSWVLNSYPELSDANGVPYSELNSTAVWQRDYCLPAMVEAFHNVTDQWIKHPNLIDDFQRLCEDLDAISPHCPQVLRLQIDTTTNPTAEQLADWEQRAANDSLSIFKVGSFHYERGDYAGAARCYERSYELCPDPSTTTTLAAAYRKNGQEEKWLPTLERYLDEKDYALGHSMIHLHIANDFAQKGKWAEAESHALAGAEVWSAGGLMTASRVCEGLGKWDESERWVREAVENYPSYQGVQWYLWCRRTGRGDLQRAKRFADEYSRLPNLGSEQAAAENEFLSGMLDGRHEDVIALVENKECFASEPYYWHHVALLAKRLGNDELYQQQMAKVMENAKGDEKSDPLYYELVKLLYDHRDEPLPAEALAEADKLLAKLVGWSRCNFEYFIGESLALEGEDEKAEEYWRRAVANGPFDKWNATFAGDRLVKKYGTSRPDESPSPTDSDAVSNSEPMPGNDES